MTSGVRIQRIDASEWRLYRDVRLAALNESPHAFGSTFAHEAKRTDSEWKNRLATLDSSLDLPLIAMLDAVPVGLAWIKIFARERTNAHLFQTWVAPDSRASGVGSLLLAEAIS